MNVEINYIIVIIHNENKKALITGITGQDGSYLSRVSTKKNYIVHGIKENPHLLTLKE